jgi:hypothetical protein
MAAPGTAPEGLPRSVALRAAGLDLSRAPFSILWPEPEGDRFLARNSSFRPATDEHWASLRYEVVMAPGEGEEELIAVVKEWVNDWWPPTCPDLPLRDKGHLLWSPSCADIPDPAPATTWVGGLHHHGAPGLSAHILGTNIEVALPQQLLPGDPLVRAFLSRFRVLARGPVSWYRRAYHPHRDVPDRGWGDGLVARLDWAPWEAAPEHPNVPPPDILVADRLPVDWRADATGARANPRLAHSERQWVVVHQKSGDPVLWGRATPLKSRQRHPLLVQVDGRYRLDWEETPVGWAGSLDPERGHHVVLLERDDLRIEAWVGLAAGLTRSGAAQVVDKIFVEPSR